MPISVYFKHLFKQALSRLPDAHNWWQFVLAIIVAAGAFFGLDLVGVSPWWSFFVVGILFVYLLFLAARDLYVQLEHKYKVSEAQVKSTLDLIFDTDKFPSCEMDVLISSEQLEHPAWGTEGSVRDNNTVPGRLFRVAVINTGIKTVTGVTVKLKDFHPQGAHFLPVPLILMHHYSNNFQASREGVVLRSGVPEYADVVQKATTTNPVFEIELQYAIASPRTLPPRSYRLLIIASGNDVPSCEKEFVIDLDEDGGLLFQRGE